MSINLTQKFVFETDCLKALETVLFCMVSIIFKSNKSQPTLYIKKKNGYCNWNDGKYGSHYDDNMPIMYKNKDGVHLLDTCGTYAGALYTKEVNDKPFKNMDQAAKEACSMRTEPKPTRMLVCELGNSPIIDGEPCTDYKDMVSKTMKLVKEVDIKQFFEEIGDGYSRGFDRFDGTVTHGYRIHQEAEYKLFVSIVHLYYGK